MRMRRSFGTRKPHANGGSLKQKTRNNVFLHGELLKDTRVYHLLPSPISSHTHNTPKLSFPHRDIFGVILSNDVPLPFTVFSLLYGVITTT